MTLCKKHDRTCCTDDDDIIVGSDTLAATPLLVPLFEPMSCSLQRIKHIHTLSTMYIQYETLIKA